MGFKQQRGLCDSGKVTYPSAIDVGLAQDWYRRRGMERWPYVCRWCDGWHLTSRSPSNRHGGT